MSTITTNTFQELATGDSVGAKYVVHGTAKAYGIFEGVSTNVLTASLNIASVTDNGTGDYTFTYTSAFLSTESSAPVVSAYSRGNTLPQMAMTQSRTANNVRFEGMQPSATSNTSKAAVDQTATVAVFGDLA
jgi:hypothetical protein